MVLIGPHLFTGPQQQRYLLEYLFRQQTTQQIQEILLGEVDNDLYPEAKNFHNATNAQKINEDFIAQSLVDCFNANIGNFITDFNRIFGTGYNIYGIDLHHHSEASNEYKGNILEAISKGIAKMLSEHFPITVNALSSPESYLTIPEVFNYTFFPGTDGEIEGNKIITCGTLSDHERISGVKKLKKLAENQGIGEKIIYNYEENVRFPEMVINGKRLKPAKVHILLPTITSKEFEEIRTFKRNIFDFVKYAKTNNIPLVLAHGLFNMENLMTEHVKIFPLLFQKFEINLERPSSDNIKLIELAHRTDTKYIEQYMNEFSKYIQDLLVHPYGLNFMTAGSDDHSGMMVRYARHATLISAKSPQNIRDSLLGKDGFVIPNLSTGMNRGIIDLWLNAFMVAIQHLRHKSIPVPTIILKMINDITPDHCEIFKISDKERQEIYSNFFIKKINDLFKMDMREDSFWEKGAKSLGNLLRMFEKILDLDFIEKIKNKKLENNPELAQRYGNVVKNKKLFEKGEIERDEYTKSIYELFGFFTNFMIKEFADDVNERNLKSLLSVYKGFFAMAQIFIEYTIQALYSNRHINKGLKAESIIKAPPRPQKTVIYMTDIDGIHGVAKSVLDFIQSKYREPNIHLISVVRNKDNFLKSDAYKILKENLGEENFTIYQAPGEIKTKNGENNNTSEDFPLLLPPIFEIAKLLGEIKPTSAIDFTQDMGGLCFERFCDALNLPVITVKDTDVGRYIEDRLEIKDMGIAGTYDTLNEFLFYRGENRYLCAPSLIYLLNKTIIDPKKKFLLQRFVDSKKFHVEENKVGINYLKKKQKNKRYDLEDLFEKYHDQEIINIVYVGRISKEKNIKTNLRHMMKYYYKNAYPGQAIPENRTFDDIKHIFGGKIPVFNIVGGGPDEDKFIAWAKKRKIPVVMYGVVKDKDKLRRLYNGSGIFYFPSRTDTFGRVIIESQACGCVPIMYNDGGPSSIIGNTNSGVIASSDDDFFDKFKLLIENSELVEQRKEEALLNIEQYFSEKAVMVQFNNIISNVERMHEAGLLNQENASGGTAMKFLETEKD